MIVQLSSGQGPRECELGVFKLFNELKKSHPDIEMLRYTQTSKETYRSIRFFTEDDLSELEGSILWICKSPYRPNHQRKNWYVDVSIIPDKKIINDEMDIKIETMRSGGAGGQHVNTTDSAVRVTHIPTGISVVSSDQRSQFQNKNVALKRLNAKLLDMQIEEEKKQDRDAWAEHYKIVRGNPVQVYEGEKFKLKS